MQGCRDAHQHGHGLPAEQTMVDSAAQNTHPKASIKQAAGRRRRPWMTASRPQAGPGAAGQIIITFLAKTRSRASLQPSAKVGSQPAAQVAAGATPETIGRPNKSCPERRGCRRTFAQRQRRTHQAKACKCFTAAGHAQQARNQAKRKNGVCSLLPRLQLRLHLLQAAQDLLSRAHTRSGRAAQQPARAEAFLLAV